MEEQSKKCPFCAETILEAAIKCKHCGSMLNETGKYDEQILIDKPANLFRGIESVGGRIQVTTQKVIFKPHTLNLQRTIEYIPLSNIESITKRNTMGLIPNGISIKLKSGVEYRLVVAGREELISIIENNK